MTSVVRHQDSPRPARTTLANLTGSPNTRTRCGLTLLAMSISQGMIMVDITIVNTALPSMQSALQMSAGSLEWVISAYALSLAALIPLGGALGDRYGRKRLFLVGLTLFAFGSLACALSATDAALIAARAVQGVGGAAISALTLAILTDTYPVDARAGAIGIWAAIGGLGFGIGPVAGGLLLSVFGWQSVFWVNVPVAVLGVAITAVAVAGSRSAEPRPLDPVGVLTSALGLLCVTLGLIESSTQAWASWPVAGPLALGAVLLIGFAAWEEHAPSPMVPPRLLRTRSFASGCGVYLLTYLAWEGVMFYVTLLYQNLDGWSALHTGLSWLAMNVPFLVMAQYAGWLHRRFSSVSVVTAGCLVAGVGIAGLSAVTPSSPFVLSGLGYGLSGIGYGTLAPGVANVAMRDVPAEVAGAASGVLSAARQVGTSVGLAVLGAIGVAAANSEWSARLEHFPSFLRPTATEQGRQVAGAQIDVVTAALGSAYRDAAIASFLHGYQLALVVAAGCVLVAGIVSLFGLRSSSNEAAHPGVSLTAR
jgi:MFS transporter, DHA2 family, methylenomycin A resistance protein